MIKKVVTAAVVLLCIFAFSRPLGAWQQGDTLQSGPLAELKHETLSYFTPVTGTIVAVDGTTLKINTGLKTGMRLQAFKEGVNFVHPVTKEPLGKVEIPVGTIEITATDAQSSSGIITSGKPEDFLNAKIKIPGTKVRLLFYQGNMDWFLGEAYYQLLKESGRFELVDTGIVTDDLSKIAAEARAKGAEAALVLTAEEFTDHISLTQKLLWTKDAKQFSEKKVAADVASVRELRFQAGRVLLQEGEVLLSFRLPYRANRLAVGDLDGDGTQEILLAAGDMIRVYQAGVDLKFLWEFKVPSTSETIWIDTIDLNKNGKYEVLITSIQGGAITAGKDEITSTTPESGKVNSYIYELRDAQFIQLWKAPDTFIRKLDRGIAGQRYHKRDGYDGHVFSIVVNEGNYKAGNELKLPPGINIYDFQYARAADGKHAVFAWDEYGYLNLFNEKGLRTWRSKEDFGGFSTVFKKESPTVMQDRGTWSVKDRLLAKESEVLLPKRKPLLGMAKGLGYKSSEIKSLWWNGIDVEERIFIENAGGEVLDYDLAGDRLIVLSRVPWGEKAKGLLKGISPGGVMLYVFSLKGK
ncbi:MAG: VCBS repeat-containing protein [Nitrospirota bacterium]